MSLLSLGPYRARLAENVEDMARSLALRQAVFRGARSASDQDGFDARCQHVLIEGQGGEVLCSYRLLPLAGGTSILTSYSAQFYDLAALAGFGGPVLELGRFCLRPDMHDPDILRVAWAMMTRIVDERGIKLLFGCSSFVGADPSPHAEALAYLAQHHLAPAQWSPAVKSSSAVGLAGVQVSRRALLGVPPLLRTYLAMGGWVSDHAVVDEALGTLHVFTGLEIGAIPPALRAARGSVVEAVNAE